MTIETHVMGPVMTNTYIISENNETIIIDPAGKAEKIIELLQDKKLLAILLTHGHFDHIKGVDGLYNHYHCPVYLNSQDEFLARDKYAGKSFNIVSYITCPTIPLKEEKMKIGPFEFEVIFTPGHTPGSVIYVFENEIFTGDTLFKGSVGRTDLEGGDNRLLKDSLRIFNSFNKEYTIYPGHDDKSLLSYELMYNPYL